MLSRNRIFLSVIFVLVAGFFFLSTPETSYAQSDCCFSHEGVGCGDQTCENIVCGIDSYCCSVNWDNICVGEAEDLCGNLCIEDISPIPTMSEWGMIAFAGILGLVSFFVIFTRRKRSIS